MGSSPKQFTRAALSGDIDGWPESPVINSEPECLCCFIRIACRASAAPSFFRHRCIRSALTPFQFSHEHISCT